MQQRVILEGDLGDKFGKVWHTSCDTLVDIFKLIECQREGYREYMLDCQEKGIMYTISRGDIPVEDESELFMTVGSNDIIITPIPAGSKGAGKLLAAIFLIWGGWMLAGAAAQFGAWYGAAWGWAATIGGYSLMLAGSAMALRTIEEMLTPDTNADDEDESHLFGGPINTVAEGVAIPIVYGEMITGGVVISASYDSLRGQQSYGSTYTGSSAEEDYGGGDIDGLQEL